MIGERIREARLAQNRSLADVAGKAKISVATLSRIENDKQSVEMGMFLLIAKVLNVPATELLDGASADDDGDGKLEPLVRRISSLPPRERLDLWRELAAERKAQRSRARGSQSRQVSQHVDELLAQVDFLREELDGVRRRIKKR
jgi:transcriptional regulator with XRE-family HTH domain